MFISSQYWKRAALSKSGRPELESQESDILIQSHIGLYQDNCKLVKFQKGKVYLTNKRIIFVSNDQGSSHHLSMDLIDIEDISLYNGFMKSSPKIILKMRKKRAESISTQRSQASAKEASEVNWICPICSFSNAVRTDIQIKSDLDVPPCRNCGVKPPQYLIQGVIQAGSKVMTPANNVVSKDGFQCPTCTFLNDVSMKNCEMCGTRLVSSSIPPQLLNDTAEKELLLELESNGSQSNLNVSSSPDLNKQIIKLSFRKGGVKTFMDKLELARDQAVWEYMSQKSKINVDVIEPGSQSEVHENKGPKFGIQGLQNKREIESIQKSLLLNNSLQDLENLMEKARDLIELSKSYQRVLPKDQKNSSLINETAKILANSKTSINILNNIITKNEFVNNSSDSSLLSSLRKKSKGSDLYVEELSRQLYEFLVDSDIITKNHGLITLYDLFLIYNKARGINLISPQELFQGVQLFDSLNFKYVLVSVPLTTKNVGDITKGDETKAQSDDKFYVISNKNFSFNSIVLKIERFFDEQQKTKNIFYGLSVLEIQKHPQIKLNINYIILNQILLNSCVEGSFCVDQELQGSFFYKNEILSYNWDDYMNGNDRVIEVHDHEIEFDIETWVSENLPDQYDGQYDDDEEEDLETGLDGSKSMNTSEYDLNYRLGSKYMTSNDELDPAEIRPSYKEFNGTLRDLEGLKF